ncbi:hypothetical protein BH23BAC1_BH23BAC1_24980 [soil metagenome]
MGTSWGSILGTKMALKRPELFHAYVGHAQVVNFFDNLNYAYQKVYKMAEDAEDKESIEKLQSWGEPPYDDGKNSGQLLRIIKKYERENSIPAPKTWWKLASEYDNKKDGQHRYEGDDYSFIHLVGHEKLGIKAMITDVDFNNDGLKFKVPVYLIQGEEDILTSKEITKIYFDSIDAPKKEYFLIPGAAHGLNQSVVDTQYQILKNHLSL